MRNRAKEKETHIIYGYREREGKHRWYVGLKLFEENRARDQGHRRAKDKGKFHNFIRKAYRTGKTFDQVLEYFEIESFFGTAQQAELREKHYTLLYNALAPHGFNLFAGRYRGRPADEVKQRISKLCTQTWACKAKRAKQAIKCSGWSHSTQTKEQIGKKSLEMWNNPEWLAARAERLKLRQAETKRRQAERKAKEKADREAKRQANPSQSMMVAKVVIDSPFPLTATQVKKALANQGIHFPGNRVITQLKRAAGYNDHKHVWQNKNTPIKASKNADGVFVFEKS